MVTQNPGGFNPSEWTVSQYSQGKDGRQTPKRYVNTRTGEDISRRQYLNRLRGGITPEQFARARLTHSTKRFGKGGTSGRAFALYTLTAEGGPLTITHVRAALRRPELRGKGRLVIAVLSEWPIEQMHDSAPQKRGQPRKAVWFGATITRDLALELADRYAREAEAAGASPEDALRAWVEDIAGYTPEGTIDAVQFREGAR
jgi:hypothetical protein